MRWLAVSLVLSVVLTVALNLGIRAFPGAGDRAARRLEQLATHENDGRRDPGRRVQVFVPWKAMIVGSLILTVLVNLLLWLR